jgi:hypothetical protein
MPELKAHMWSFALPGESNYMSQISEKKRKKILH